MDGITRETFSEMDVDSKLNILFDFSCEAKDVRRELRSLIETKRKIDTTVAAISGFFGGAFAVIGKILLLGK